MPSPELVNITALLAPIPGDQPAGTALPFAISQRLEEDRKEWEADNDPVQPRELKKANWSAVVRLAQEALTQTSKDLLLAARLTEALVKVHHFAGLRDGLRLFHGLVDQCWDRLHPPMEDGDLEVRAGPFIWLDNPVRGARFPTTLRQIPLLTGNGFAYTLQHCDQSTENPLRVPQDEIEKAIKSASRERLVELDEHVNECLTELERLRKSLDVRMKEEAPGLTEVGKVLESTQIFLRHALRECPVSDGKSDTPSEDPRKPAGPSATVTSRAEAYRQLAQVAARLKQLEPHSPIPYLLERAVELGGLPFPQLIKALVRDVNVLAELNREFGLKESSDAPNES